MKGDAALRPVPRRSPSRRSGQLRTGALASAAAAVGLGIVSVLAVGSGRALAQAPPEGESTPAAGAAGLSDEQAQARISPVNLVKLLAQRAALPFLRGDERFVLRESWWNGRISPGDSKLIQVQLFSRNAYQFWLAVPSRDAVVDLNLYDSEGTLVDAEYPEIEGSNLVSLLVEPDRSGLYYLRVALRPGEDGEQQPAEQEWGVIYAYR